MAQIGTYGAASIIAVPPSPGLRQIELTMNDTVAVSTSPWTGSQQTQWYPNDGWSGEITLPLMTIVQIGAWESWLSELRGMANVFYLGHPLRRSPQGKVSGKSNPVSNGILAPMSTTIATKGWELNRARLLLPGDHIQIGNRLHRVLNAVSSDASGNASINIWPIVRESTPDGTNIILHDPKGLFRLAENKRSVTHTETRLGSVTVKIMEAK